MFKICTYAQKDNMKVLILTFLISLSSFAQGLLFEDEKDVVLEGPSILKLGKSTSGNLININSEVRLFADNVKGISKEVKEAINPHIRNVNKQEIYCTGSSTMLNGVITSKKIRVCIKKSNGQLLYNSIDMGPDQILKERAMIDAFLWNRISEQQLKQYIDNSSRKTKKEAPHKTHGEGSILDESGMGALEN